MKNDRLDELTAMAVTLAGSLPDLMVNATGTFYTPDGNVMEPVTLMRRVHDARRLATSLKMALAEEPRRKSPGKGGD